MSKCKYCGEKAGLFKDRHDECEQKYLIGKQKFYNLLKTKVFKNPDWTEFKEQLEKIAISSFFSQSDARTLIIEAWDDVKEELKKGEEPLLSDQELSAKHFKDQSGLSPNVINDNRSWNKLIQSHALNLLLLGKLPNRCSFSKEDLPVMFQNDEKLIWVYENDTKYYKIESKSKRVGNYSGWSVKVVKGLYYKWGNFESRSIKTLQSTHIDTGHLILTSENLYFYGANKGFKLPYKRMMAIEPYSDGVKIQKTHANAFPIAFITDDGLFTYYLLIQLVEIATNRK